MSATTNTRPVNPNAANIRAACKAAGVDHKWLRITSGRNSCHIQLSYDAPQDVWDGRLAYTEKVVAAISGLWNDSDTRIWRMTSDIVLVDRRAWYRTTPAPGG